MSSEVQDRLISASEVERWCYCPLSWKLEREGAHEDRSQLDPGETGHRKIGAEISVVRTAQEKAREDRMITWTFLIFSVLLLLMGISLVAVARVGSLDIDIWKVGVIFLSILMIGISVVYYFRMGGNDGAPSGGAMSKLARGLDSKTWKRSNTPLLFYFYGMRLMLNGIILMRPFGLGSGTITTVLAASLLVLYAILLVSFTIYFRSHRSDIRKGELRIGGPLLLMLLISLSVLFIFISDRIDTRGNMGWVFLFISLLWFIGAIGYDLAASLKKGKIRGKGNDQQELPIATLALLASVFTASTFLAKGDNLDEYYWASVVIAGAWLSGAAFFFWRGLHQKRVAEEGLSGLELPSKAEVVVHDDLELRKGSKPLTSSKHYLIGTPDLILEEDGFKIPVEVKTGRIPPRPHFSHIMQLSAYLLLMDVNYSQETPHGYLDYTPGKTERKRFTVEWDLMTRALVLSKVSEIREADRTHVAHRNHVREGKCRNCSRRQGCPEKLV
ncbi:MAG: PD-(D/E)XK nuclease family protein [Thermoplasmatota archaeon]